MSTLDPLRALFPSHSDTSTGDPVLEPLTSEGARALRLPWLSRFSSHSLLAHLQSAPDMSLWVPATGEYVLARPWRSRADIAEIVEATARRGKQALISGLCEKLRGLGYRLVLMTDDVWRDGSPVYTAAGFKQIEQIVFFTRNLGPRHPLKQHGVMPPLTYTRLGIGELDLLLRLDHASFPWLWWNSREEFEPYIQTQGVYVYAAQYAGEFVGYASYTMYDGWAHLDRLAVVTPMQGRRYGAAQLLQALGNMAQLGAGSVTLSTQQNNTQSHKLYKAFGFSQAPDRMNLYAAELAPGAGGPAT